MRCWGPWLVPHGETVVGAWRPDRGARRPTAVAWPPADRPREPHAGDAEEPSVAAALPSPLLGESGGARRLGRENRDATGTRHEAGGVVGPRRQQKMPDGA